jgi:hypothetical protein
MIEALLCAIGGALIGGAFGFCYAESLITPSLDAALDDLRNERDEHAATRADRDRWKGVANTLHDENDAQREFLAPLFKVKDN